VIPVSDGRTSDETGLVLVEATSYSAWKGAVLPGSAGLVFAGAGLGLPELGLVLAGLAMMAVGALRAAWWARVCSTSRLVDRGNALVWIYRGEVREEVAWSDLRHVLFRRWSPQVMWSLGPQSGGPFPFVLVDSRADPPPPGFRHFAETMVLDQVVLETADRALAEACRRHGVTYHGIDSDW
jgi:hypothetical protein